MDFDEGIKSNHRMLWVDIEDTQLWGSTDLAHVPPRARRLKNQDPRVRGRYLEELSKRLQEKDIPNQIFKLETMCGEKISKETRTQMDRLVKERNNAMVEAEKKCRKLKMGAYHWSPAIKEARQAIRIWTLLKRKLKGKKYKQGHWNGCQKR